MLYHLFYCSDYKGGELHCRPNLNLEEAIDTVYDDCFRYFEENECELDSDESILSALDKYFDENYWTYAGGGRSCPELFVIDGDELKNIWFTTEQLLNYVKKNL